MRGSVLSLRGELARRLMDQETTVHPRMWQGREVPKVTSLDMIELCMVNFAFSILSEDLDFWRADCDPNLPWADDHFEERVCGWPINPGKEWANWPWGNHADNFREAEQFNHNYMERYWPKYANRSIYARPRIAIQADPWPKSDVGPYLHPITQGIRYEYGDLNDVIDLLAQDPLTRQAYLPMFYPEDNSHNGRKPCSLGYQFFMRQNQLHIYYPMRSCDFVRHFKDDIYLTIRLLLWVLGRLKSIDPEWSNVTPGEFHFHATSLHCWVNDRRRISEEYGL